MVRLPTGVLDGSGSPDAIRGVVAAIRGRSACTHPDGTREVHSMLRSPFSSRVMARWICSRVSCGGSPRSIPPRTVATSADRRGVRAAGILPEAHRPGEPGRVRRALPPLCAAAAFGHATWRLRVSQDTPPGRTMTHLRPLPSRPRWLVFPRADLRNIARDSLLKRIGQRLSCSRERVGVRVIMPCDLSVSTFSLACRTRRRQTGVPQPSANPYLCNQPADCVAFVILLDAMSGWSGFRRSRTCRSRPCRRAGA
jgi:hypothetical protein